MVDQNWQKDNNNIFLQCILTACILFGLVVLCLVVTIMINDDALTDIHDYYYQYISSYALRFIEIFWQVLNLVLSYATYIGSWFRRSILHFSTLLDAHFPGGIPGIAFAIIIAFLVLKVDRLSKAHTRCMNTVKYQQEVNTRCMEEKQELQLKLEDVTLKLQEENGKLVKESEKVEKLTLSLEDEKDKRLCWICQDHVKTIVLLPCQHLYLCKQCLDHEKWKNCPICRQDVESTMEIYV